VLLVKGISAAEAHTATQRLLTADPSLAHLGPLLAPKAFVDDGYIGLGVPIGTDAFVQHFVKKKCQEIMDDVDKLDTIQDGFIHYQLVRFCQSKRPPAAACRLEDQQRPPEAGHPRRLQDMEPAGPRLGRHAAP
jgi:hypothetical protein